MKTTEENYDAVVDILQRKVYRISECDKEMIEAFPKRYKKVKLSEQFQKEISDDEILLESKTHPQKIGFENGAKWYRKQIKK